MMQGRKPKPAALRLVAGNPGRRPIKPEVASAPGMPEPPAYLIPLAIEQWHRSVALMAAIGTLGQENREVLAIYCQAWGRMVEAEDHVSKFGQMVPAPRTGVPMHNPHMAIAYKSAETVSRLAAELGFTPSSRSRVTAVSKPNAGNPFARNGSPPTVAAG
jgi:P27 family predicted phage terminase small subunit